MIMTTTMNGIIKSPLRYPGGKTRAQRVIQAEIDRAGDISEFRDVMVGGGSTFIALHQRRPEVRISINDESWDLMCFYQEAKRRNALLVDSLHRILNGAKDTRALYDCYRHYDSTDPFERALRFFVMNRITFSGTVDSGGYSVSTGRFNAKAIERIRPLEGLLKDVEVMQGDYQDFVESGDDNTLLFVDPPYSGNGKSGIYGRNGDVHREFDHLRLRGVLGHSSHKWILTYDDTEEIRALYRGFEMKSFTLQYGMNNVYGVEKAPMGSELLITNF